MAAEDPETRNGLGTRPSAHPRAAITKGLPRPAHSLVPSPSRPSFYLEAGMGRTGNVQSLQLNGWDGIRVRLGPGYGIVSGDASRNTYGGVQLPVHSFLHITC